jgi:hypothetical protein
VGTLGAHAGTATGESSATMKGVPRKPHRPRAAATRFGAFPPLSDQELVEFLRELTATLPDDLAETVTAALERGDDPGALARVVRNELRSRGQIPS